MKKQLLLLPLISIIIIILEILPYGAVLVMAEPHGSGILCTYSYFSHIPYGYANCGPLLTAITSCLILIFSIIMLACRKKGIITAFLVLSIAALVFSLLPCLFGWKCVSWIGIVISLLLGCEVYLGWRLRNQKLKK